MSETIAIVVSRGKVLLDKIGDEYIFPAYKDSKSSLMIAYDLVEDYLGLSPNWTKTHWAGQIDGSDAYLVLVQEPVQPLSNLSEWVDLNDLPNLAGNISSIVKYLTKIVGVPSCQN